MGESSYTKLNDENYDAWEFEIRAELKRKGVLGLVEGRDSRPMGSENSKAVKGWSTKRDLASAEIIRRLEVGQFAHVRGHEDDPVEMWKRLKEFHLASGLGSLIAMWGKFTKFLKADDVPMHTHIGNVRTLADKLKNLGDPPSDALTIAVLFASLPAQFGQLIVSLDSHPKSTDLDFVIGRILNEDTRLMDTNTSSVAPANSPTALSANRRVVDKTKITCFKCGRLGHFQSECTSNVNAVVTATNPPMASFAQTLAF